MASNFAMNQIRNIAIVRDVPSAYDSTTTSSNAYSAGDEVMYQGKLYVAKATTSGAWTAADWEEQSLAGIWQVNSNNGTAVLSVNEPDQIGSNNTLLYSFDNIDLNKIRDMRISKPAGKCVRKWTLDLTAPGTPFTVGEDYVLKFVFEDVHGYGLYDNYIATAVVRCTSSNNNATAMANDFATAIDNAFKTHAKPFASVTATAGVLVITEKEPYYDRLHHSLPRNLELRLINSTVKDSSGVEVNWIRPFASPSTTAQHLQHDGWIEAEDTYLTANGHYIDSMQHFLMKVRSDKYGMDGWPDVNLSAMIGIDLAATYYCLDIKYFLQEAGMLNQNSEKELTVVSKSYDTLKAIVDAIEGTTVTMKSTTGETVTSTSGVPSAMPAIATL